MALNDRFADWDGLPEGESDGWFIHKIHLCRGHSGSRSGIRNRPVNNTVKTALVIGFSLKASA